MSVKADVINQRGVLADIALAVSDTRADIEDIDVVEHDDQHYVVNLTLRVRGRSHLAKVFRQVRKVRSVLKVARGR